MAQERPGHPVERSFRAPCVVAAPAVHVDVDEAGGDERAARLGRVELDLGDPAVAHHDPPRADVLVEDQAPADDGLAVHDATPAPAASARTG